MNEMNKINAQEMMDNMFKALEDKCPEIVTRKKVTELTGGLVSEKTLANLDVHGEGIQPALRIGGKTAYPKAAVLIWLRSNCRFK